MSRASLVARGIAAAGSVGLGISLFFPYFLTGNGSRLEHDVGYFDALDLFLVILAPTALALLALSVVVFRRPLTLLVAIAATAAFAALLFFRVDFANDPGIFYEPGFYVALVGSFMTVAGAALSTSLDA
jgi:hypothetical protein